ncbi:BZ3500_MvSof-1268-A1-R1_Chr1-1g00820 [Microbotryum saponariae]|uniref:UDP-N-acetylglucosamine diphosphorylase n=1 Tax=Microbotryum saponariae TaxID=289078 RepID=A0A2X0K7C4_9BASI|nr:BZ3500_MvSof-1268-A1-R1_Chr1-1g00820 [Microbotryum saponariae]SCZ92742.1 BZ3501_MvSof-1269-A2-R1_Chr1-1g00417 [Microbotryum saponariae]
MSSPSPATLDSIRARYAAADQSHVLHFYDTLNPTQQHSLLSQLSTIDPERVNRICAKAREMDASASSSSAPSESESETDTFSPPPRDRVGVITPDSSNSPQVQEWTSQGLSSIRRGQVAILLLAGGQGTRLGSSAPKGCYDIGLPSHKSLFQLQAERIKRLQIVAQEVGGEGVGEGKNLVWYIMTSGPTRGPTEQFFRENRYFGLQEGQVVFFEQGVLPCLSNDGKILLDTPSSVAVAPDGNGGLYSALDSPLSSTSSTTVLSDLQTRGIKYLHAYCVDNCLVRVSDPTFLGYCISQNASCGAKVVTKTQPTESVGVVALKNDRYTVIEYSELPTSLSESRDEKGELSYRAANIANHFYSLDFLSSIRTFSDQLTYHIASKKIPHISIPSGNLVKPTTPNGIKLELFIFDVFPFVEPPSFALLQVSRSTDFSPLKNAPGTGSDDPFTSRRDLLNEHRRWLIEAGAELEEGVQVELSALVSYAGEGLDWVKGCKVRRSGRVEKREDWEGLCLSGSGSLV